jgi:Zn-dependent peptidase ImmA (M78 family)
LSGDAINYARVRKRAHELLSGQLRPPVDLVSIAAKLGAEIRYFDLKEDISGILYREDDRKVIVVNQKQLPTRQRFTTAHELGHLALHRGVPVHVDHAFRINLRDPSSARGTDVEEIEANAFAANLLMPAHWLRNELRSGLVDFDNSVEVANLAVRYQVSQQAMLFRLTSIFAAPEQTKARDS